MNRYYIVKNITSSETGQQGILENDTYTIVKKKFDDYTIPSGEVVTELSYEETIQVVSLNIFTTNYTGIRPYKIADKNFCGNLVLEFQSGLGALSLSDTELLISPFVDGSGLLDEVLVKLNINSPHHAKVKLESVQPTNLFPQELKDLFLNKINDYLQKFPR